MKTIRQHLKSLPEPYRTQALENAKTLNGKASKQVLDDKRDTAADAVSGAFYWSESPQGHQYWSNFKATLSRTALFTNPSHRLSELNI